MGSSWCAGVVPAGQNDEDVARMRIGVKVATVRNLLQVGMREFVGELGEIVFDPADRRNLVDLDAPDALGGEHLVRRVGIDDARNQNVGECRQSFAELSRVTSLGAIVQLVDQRALDLLHHANQVDARARRCVFGEERSQLTEELDVLRQLLAQIRTLNLDHHVASVPQHGGVNLAEAGAAKRLLLERLEELADTRAQLLFDGLLDFLERHRRDVVLKVLQLVDVRLGEQVGSRRKDLSELDVGRPELDEPLAKGLRLRLDVSLYRRLILEAGALQIEQALTVGEVAQAIIREEPDG